MNFIDPNLVICSTKNNAKTINTKIYTVIRVIPRNSQVNLYTTNKQEQRCKRLLTVQRQEGFMNQSRIL